MQRPRWAPSPLPAQVMLTGRPSRLPAAGGKVVLGKDSHHAQGCRGSHPEQRPRPAHSESRRHPHNIPCADGPGQRRCQRLKPGGSPLLPFSPGAAQRRPQPAAYVEQLVKAALVREPGSRSQNQQQHMPAPQGRAQAVQQPGRAHGPSAPRKPAAALARPAEMDSTPFTSQASSWGLS